MSSPWVPGATPGGDPAILRPSDGEYVDEIWMSILADEWRQHHGRPGTD